MPRLSRLLDKMSRSRDSRGTAKPLPGRSEPHDGGELFQQIGKGPPQLFIKLVADLTANSVSASQIDSITGYLDDWESVSFDDKRKVVDILISQIDATSEEVTIHWKI